MATRGGGISTAIFARAWRIEWNPNRGKGRTKRVPMRSWNDVSACPLRFLKRNTRSLARAVVDRKRDLDDVDDNDNDDIAEKRIVVSREERETKRNAGAILQGDATSCAFFNARLAATWRG
ncbi:hypothetical protein WN51_06170 [Melipona quadrifasciata]|uniref:Uncharacterized protein n=1 Tax=Melipona quadrifasciata TaxID=166423 RepID=A0A0M8ZT57_9HYME|nr:hypothetical protein WN51_06170 [Melipona quadrifasciata]